MPRPAYTRIVIDIATNDVIERVSIPYSGPWEMCKGGNSAAATAAAAKVSQEQLDLQKTQLGIVNPQLKSIIDNGGLLPSTEAAMRSQALNGLGSQYQNLYGALSQSLNARGMTGGQNAGAGGVAANFGALGAAQAGQATQALEGVQLAKAQGLQNALGMGLGEAQSTGQLGTQALGSQVTAANNTDQAQTGFWGSMIGGLAGLGSSAMAKGAFTCWVAAELYGGWFAPETISIRSWLYRTKYMSPFLFFYRLLGERWAELIRTRPLLRRSSKLLFDLFLRLANE